MRFLDQKAAAITLSKQIVKGEKPVIFMFGAGGSAPRLDSNKKPVTPGVPLTGEVVEIVARHLGVDPSSLGDYQSAFDKLIESDSKGKATLDLRRANLVIREAVLRALRTPDPSLVKASGAQFTALEADPKQWWIPDAYRALALLGAHYPNAMGGMVLTTNFDPLIEVAMTHARSPWLATALHEDGSLQFTWGSGPHVVHLHGHWWNSDTLHTEVQLQTK
ncbi:hypothetical protein, partial [Methylorubrum thiocyanatum]